MPKDFSKYMSGSVDDIPQFLPYLPLGHYFAEIVSWKNDERFYDKSNPKKGTAVVTLFMKVTGTDGDVDMDALHTMYPNSDGTGELLSKDYDIQTSLGGKVTLRKIAEKYCGVDVKGMELSDLLDAVVGSKVKVYNEPRQGQEEGQFYNNAKQVLPAHD